MRKYDFDRVTPRREMGALKWDTGRLFKQDDLIPLWVADMDFPAPPEVVELMTSRAEHGIYGYSSRKQSYHDALIGWLDRRHRWKIQQEWIAYAPGVVPALSMLVLTFTEPGDRIVLQSPVYPPFFEVIGENGRVVAENELVLRDGSYEMDLADLEKHLSSGAKMMFLCNPHNPVGRVWREDELRKVVELCQRYGVLLVSDEIHADLVYPNHRHIPVASLSEEAARQTITCLSTGKTFNLAGLHTAAVIIPDAARKKAYEKTLRALHLFIENYFGSFAAQAAYTYGEEWLDELIVYLQGNLDFLEQTIRRELPGVHLIRPEGTYLAWLDVRAWGMSPTAIKKWMYQEAKVALNEGSTFGRQGAGFLRINLACPRVTLAEGLSRIVRAQPR